MFYLFSIKFQVLGHQRDMRQAWIRSKKLYETLLANLIFGFVGFRLQGWEKMFDLCPTYFQKWVNVRYQVNETAMEDHLRLGFRIGCLFEI